MASGAIGVLSCPSRSSRVVVVVSRTVACICTLVKAGCRCFVVAVPGCRHIYSGRGQD